eukprot:3326062-Alexandrium_andersonii.AAC.1
MAKAKQHFSPEPLPRVWGHGQPNIVMEPYGVAGNAAVVDTENSEAILLDHKASSWAGQANRLTRCAREVRQGVRIDPSDWTGPTAELWQAFVEMDQQLCG